MTALRIVLSLLALVFVVATVLPLVRSSAWWVRMFDFPRMQIAVGALVMLAVYGVVGIWSGEPETWEWALFAALAASALYQAYRMWPYTRLHPHQTLAADPALMDPDRRLRLVVSNVLMSNRDGERWLRTVRQADPDVVVAVETDEWWVETAGALKQTHPHAVELPQDDTYGMCVYSRLPLDSVEVRHLVEPEVPSLNLVARLRSGEPVSLVFLHPRPPRPDIRQDSRLRDAELVIAGRDVAQVDRPAVVAGDLNDVAWSRSTTLFQKLSGLLDPRIGRGTFSTYHAEHWWLRYPLDHVFHSDDFALVEIRRLEAVGSDHFPMLIELQIEPSAEPLQEAPDAHASDRETANEVVEEAQEFKADESQAEHQERIEEDV